MINFSLSSFLISTLDYSSSNAHTTCKLILRHAGVSGNGCVVVAPSASAWSWPAFWAVEEHHFLSQDFREGAPVEPQTIVSPLRRTEAPHGHSSSLEPRTPTRCAGISSFASSSP